MFRTHDKKAATMLHGHTTVTIRTPIVQKLANRIPVFPAANLTTRHVVFNNLSLPFHIILTFKSHIAFFVSLIQTV